MKATFHPNEILYIKGIGYAKLAIDKQKDKKTNDSTKATQNTTQTQSLGLEVQETNEECHFYPDMFRIDSQSSFAQNQVQINLSQHNTRKNSMQLRRQPSQLKNRQPIIVPLRLQRTNAMIYCPQTYLMKKITLVVKSLLYNCRKEVHVQVQITKTIDSFKHLVFKELGEDMGFYSDVRLFVTTPMLDELNMGSKTIAQYLLKDKCRITLIGKFMFTFKALAQGKEEHFALSNSNTTIAQVPKKVQPSTTTQQTPPATTTTTTQPLNKQQPQAQQPNPQPPAKTQQKPQQPQQSSQKQLQPSNQPLPKKSQHQKLYLQCNAKLRSGLHYWEVKIDKLSVAKDHTSLLIGVCLKGQDIEGQLVKLWAYDPIRAKKIESQMSQKHQMLQKDEKQVNGSDQSDEEYGSCAKTGDTIGVLLTIKEQTANLIFYKNSTCLQQCYQIPVQKLRKKPHTHFICPFVSLSGQIQLTLDSKAAKPLDSFRYA